MLLITHKCSRLNVIKLLLSFAKESKNKTNMNVNSNLDTHTHIHALKPKHSYLQVL